MPLKSLASKLLGRRRAIAEHAASVPDISSPAPRDRFYEWTDTLGPSATVLEVGTKQWVAGVSTHLRDMFSHLPRANYVMADVEDGTDVDCVADLHALPDDWSDRFDAVIAVAVFEHLARPWIAANEIRRVLKPDGRCYIATHQTFPLHGYPSDFFRFSKEALALIFEDAGLQVVDVAYEHRAWIRLPAALVPYGRFDQRFVDAWNASLPSYVGVHLLGRRIDAGDAAGADRSGPPTGRHSTETERTPS